MKTPARTLLAIVALGSLLVWAGATPAAAHDQRLVDGDEGQGNSVEDGLLSMSADALDKSLVDGDEGQGNSAEDGII